MRLWAWIRALWFRWIGPRSLPTNMTEDEIAATWRRSMGDPPAPVLMVAIEPPQTPPVHVPETVPVSTVIEHRYRVVRQHKNVTYQAYAGNDGARAVLAWEAYRESKLRGTFWFLDTHHDLGHRGTFIR